MKNAIPRLRMTQRKGSTVDNSIPQPWQSFLPSPPRNTPTCNLSAAAWALMNSTIAGDFDRASVAFQSRSFVGIGLIHEFAVQVVLPSLSSCWLTTERIARWDFSPPLGPPNCNSFVWLYGNELAAFYLMEHLVQIIPDKFNRIASVNERSCIEPKVISFLVAPFGVQYCTTSFRTFEGKIKLPNAGQTSHWTDTFKCR